MGQRLIISEEERSLISQMYGLVSEQSYSGVVSKILDYFMERGKQTENGDELSIEVYGGPGNEMYGTLKADKIKNAFLEHINMDMSEHFKKYKTVKIMSGSGYNAFNKGVITLTRENTTDDFSMDMKDNFDN